MSSTWLSYLKLSDAYDRKARFVPGLLAMLPLLPAAAAYQVGAQHWTAAVVSDVGLGAVIAVALSHLSSAFGNRLQRRLWPDWPHDAPTNEWLQPGSKMTSAQQRQLWYEALREITGLDLAHATAAGPPRETTRAINDAVGRLRNMLWQAPEGERLRLHNADYGFARNLTGLRLLWIPFSLGSMLSCWAGFFWLDHALLWAVVSTIVAAAIVPIGLFVLPTYVRDKARHYAESFFAALMAFHSARGTADASTG